MTDALTRVARALGSQPDDPDRVFRLHDGEHVPDGMRRIARGQLHNARDTLGGASKRRLPGAVHDARKALKRLRATVRLSRDAVGDEIYERENVAYRNAGRRLSASREADVLLQTLEALRARFTDELPARVTDRLRATLQTRRERALEGLRDDDRAIAAVLSDVDDALIRTPAWTFQHDGFDALAPGLRRIYRRGRKRMRAAREDPSPENLHAWRKRVKDLRYATQILRPAEPERLRKLAKRAHKLADVLGDAHDLHVLRDFADQHPECFDDEAARAALLAVIDRRSSVLRDRALKRGERLYARSPKRFVARIAQGWQQHAAPARPPVAG